MQKIPSILLILSIAALLVGVIVRILVKQLFMPLPRSYGDPIFYWHGAMAGIGIVICIVLIQIRDKIAR